MKLAWGAKVSRDFALRVIAIAVGFDPSWLMACICFESRFNPAAKNPGSSATGLIQFMRATAERLGTTVEELAAMSAEEQLNFVAAYMAEFAPRIRTLSDCYMAILWPAAIGKPEDAIIFPPGSQAYLANRGLDLDHDGAVTKAEASARVAALLAEGLQDGNVAEILADATADTSSAGGPMPIAIGLLAQLIPSVLNLFSSRAQATIAEKTGADPQVASQFFQTLIQKVGDTVGVPVTSDAAAIQAVAALTGQVKDDAARIAKLEADSLDSLHDLTEAMRGVVAVRKDEVAIETASADAASSRSDAAKVRRRIDAKLWWAYGVAAVILSAIALAELIINQSIDGQIIGALILAFGGLGSNIATTVSYGYGSSGSSGAKDVLIGEMARRAK